jgi:hypothetical protein
MNTFLAGLLLSVLIVPGAWATESTRQHDRILDLADTTRLDAAGSGGYVVMPPYRGAPGGTPPAFGFRNARPPYGIWINPAPARRLSPRSPVMPLFKGPSKPSRGR